MKKSRLLKLSDRGEDVRQLQVFYNSLGIVPQLETDGKFGPKMKASTEWFQEICGLKVDGIVGKWTMQEAEKRGFQKHEVYTRDIDEVIIHVTAGSFNETVESIRNFHVNKNGWKDIGYHGVVTADGNFHMGRDWDVIGAGVNGNNTGTLHLVYTSRGDDYDNNASYGKYMTDAQKVGMVSAAAEALYKLGLEITDLSGHNDYDSGKACPCFKVRKSKEFLGAVSTKLQKLRSK